VPAKEVSRGRLGAKVPGFSGREVGLRNLGLGGPSSASEQVSGEDRVIEMDVEYVDVEIVAAAKPKDFIG